MNVVQPVAQTDKTYSKKMIELYQKIPKDSPLNQLIHGCAVSIFTQLAKATYHATWMVSVAVVLFGTDKKEAKYKMLEYVATAFFQNAVLEGHSLLLQKGNRLELLGNLFLTGLFFMTAHFSRKEAKEEERKLMHRDQGTEYADSGPGRYWYGKKSE